MMTDCIIKREGFLLRQGSTFIFRHLTLKKSLKRFMTEYIPDVRFFISLM